MRLEGDFVATDHDLIMGVGAEDHHPTTEVFRIIVNSLSIPPGTYIYNVALGKSGCRSVRGILRGSVSVDIQGHTGLFFQAFNTAAKSSSVGIRPYPSGTQSYVGGYSRLHGDTYLSHTDFGGSIRLNDVYISGTNLVFAFYNIRPFNQNLVCYGSVVVK